MCVCVFYIFIVNLSGESDREEQDMIGSEHQFCLEHLLQNRMQDVDMAADEIIPNDAADRFYFYFRVMFSCHSFVRFFQRLSVTLWLSCVAPCKEAPVYLEQNSNSPGNTGLEQKHRYKRC